MPHAKSAQNTPSPRNAGLGEKQYLELFEQLSRLVDTEDRRQIGIRASDLIAELLDVEACSIMLLDASGAHLQLIAATHIPSSEWEKIRQPIDQGAGGTVLRTGKTEWIRNRKEFMAHFGRESTQQYGTPSCVIAPLRIKGECAGVVNVTNPRDGRAFLERDVELIEAAARLIGSALSTALQHEETIRIKKNLEDIFNSLHVGIIQVSRDGHVAQINQRARELFGLQLVKDAESLELDEVVPLTVYNTCLRLVNRVRERRDACNEKLLLTLNGKPTTLEVKVNPMEALGLLPDANVILFEDIGQEEEVQRLREAERMKHNFLAMISHELRTPLAVIKGSVPLINPGPQQDREIPPKVLGQVHQLLSSNCGRLNDVINTILDFTEIENGTIQLNFRPVNLHELLERILAQHQDKAHAKRLAYEREWDESLPEIQADERRLASVFSELVLNAVKFSNPDQAVRIVTRRDGPWVDIEISNVGPPIDPAMQKSIFKKFFQCEHTMTRKAGGCGLGLFLVYNMARLHGGTVRLLRSEQTETTFQVRLPIERFAGRVSA